MATNLLRKCVLSLGSVRLIQRSKYSLNNRNPIDVKDSEKCIYAHQVVGRQNDCLKGWVI